ncbi:MAG: O-antigen ligase family protein [Lachnospira sp.]|nr:O-antigen ligase family protein [Lachnospira sp.]
MSILLVCMGLFILMISIACLFYNPQYTIIGCVMLIDIDFCFQEYMVQNSYQAIFKLLILLSVIILILKSRKGISKWIIGLCGILFCISFVLLKKYQLPNFYLSDVITSFLTTITGFLLMYVTWKEELRIAALKALAWAAPFSVVMGILLNGYIFTHENKLSGLDSPASLVIVAAVGVLACYILSTVYKQSKYFVCGFLNFVICGLCNMRGGLLFLCVIMLGIIFPYLKKISKKLLQNLILILPVFLVLSLFIGKRIIERMFDMSYSVGNVGDIINTSNRIFAWTEILKATKQHRILGWGIGYTKKIDGVWLHYGYRAVHNEYLRWLVESGYIGVIAVILCFILVYLFLKKYNIGIHQSIINMFFIGFAIFSYTDNTMYGTAGWMTISLMLSLMGQNVNKKGEIVKANMRQFKIKLRLKN